MDQNPQEPTLEESVQQVMQALPPVIRTYLTQAKYMPVVKKLTDTYGLRVDQSGLLERELTLLLMGIEHPDEFIKALSEEGSIDAATVQKIVKDVNDQIFVPLRAEEEKTKTPDVPAPSVPAVAPAPAPRPFVPHAGAPLPPKGVLPNAVPAPLPPKSTTPSAPTPALPPSGAPDLDHLLEEHEAVMPAASAPAPDNLPGVMVAPEPELPKAAPAPTLEVPAPVSGPTLVVPEVPTPPVSPAPKPPTVPTPPPAPAPAATPKPLVKEYSVDPYREPVDDGTGA